MTLHLARDLDLPDTLVVEKQAILAMSGAGKSNTAVVLAEAMYDAGLPWVAIDPKGDWWGIRAGRDGKGAGLKVPVLGGLHGDVPLEPTGGKLIANLIADKRLTCVLDVSEFDTRQQLFRFLADFAETLLKRNTEPLHIFAEEADEYLPQSAREKGELLRCLGAWQRLVKRGRFRGIGSTLITQRSASINKDVLNMTDTLIVMRTNGTRDRKAIEEWVVMHDGNSELIDSLPTLADGEAWIWSPQKLKLTKRVTFSRRRTYDSGATPLLDGKAAKVATLADIDLDALKDEMAETIERAQADDPTLLRSRIRDLERELKQRPTEQTVREVEVPVEVSVVPEGAAAELRALLADYDRTIAAAVEVADRFERRANELATAIGGASAVRAPRTSPTIGPSSSSKAPSSTSSAPRVVPAPTVILGEDFSLPKGARNMLVALAQFPGGMTKSQLGTMSKIKKTGGTFAKYQSMLRSAGLIEVNGADMTITAAGLERAGISDVRALTGEELIDSWRDRLPGGCRRMFDLLVEAYPKSIDRDVIAEQAEITRTGGTFPKYLSILRSNGLVDVEGSQITASETLFL